MYKTDALTIAPREYIVAGVGLEPTSAAYETALETTSRHPALWYSWYDSNIQPSAYQADALTTCATRVFISVLQAGFEPATSSFVARCSNPLSYWSDLSFKSESNQHPALYKRAALPIELLKHLVEVEGLEPPKPYGSRVTVCPHCR